MAELDTRSEAVLSARQEVLELMAHGAPLRDVLMRLAEVTESVAPDVRCSVLLVEDGTLLEGAAPSLPSDYNAVVNGLRAGPLVGSCGAAVFWGQRVIVSDTRTHPNWSDFQHWVDAADLRACWSEPIFAPGGEVVGSFALYYREVREPQPFELDFIISMAQVAGIAIQGTRLESRNKQNELVLRKILDLEPNMLFVKDWEGRFLLANEATARVYGLTVAELMQASHEELHPDQAEFLQMRADDRAVMESGRPRFIPEESFLGADGVRRVLQTTKIPYEFAGEGVRAVLGVAVDITERKRVEESLRESEERFRQLAEEIREVFWLTDWQTGQVLYVSPAYEAIWGAPCEDLYADARSWIRPIHPDDHAAIVEAFRRDAPQGSYDVEYRLIRPDGGLRWIHDRAFPIYDDQGRVSRVAGLSEDVTERKQTELQLAQALAELEVRSQARMRSLEADLLWAEERERRRLAVDLHDGLNQVLTLSLMKLSALEGKVDGAARTLVQEVAELVDQANRSARTLTFQLSPPVLFDLGFEAALQWLADDIQKSYGLQVVLGGEIGLATESAQPLDERMRVLLFRAVRELLINVAKHAAASQARVTLMTSEEDISVSVSDNGIAFDARVVGHRGLGLSSIRERLESLGGSMLVESVRGQGTSVSLTAPLRLVSTTENDK